MGRENTVFCILSGWPGETVDMYNTGNNSLPNKHRFPYFSVYHSECHFYHFDFGGVMRPSAVVSIETSCSWVTHGWMWSLRATQEVLRILGILLLIILVLFVSSSWGCSDLQLSLLNPEPWPAQVYDWPPVRYNMHTHMLAHMLSHMLCLCSVGVKTPIHTSPHAERFTIPALQWTLMWKKIPVLFFIFVFVNKSHEKRPKPTLQLSFFTTFSCPVLSCGFPKTAELCSF